jgi:hypothetical protein
MRRTAVTVPANGRAARELAGDFFFIETASADATVNVYSVQHGQLGEGLLVSTAAGYRFRERGFDKLEFVNDTGSDITLTVCTGEGEAFLNVLSGTVEVENFAAPTVDSSASVAIAAGDHLDIAADTARRVLILKGAGANGDVLWVRDSSATCRPPAPCACATTRARRKPFISSP